MSLRPIVRALTIPVLGLALATITAHPALAESEKVAPTKQTQTVNINQASVTELSHLPRVGEKLAERIVAYRTENGPFKRAEDLMEVKGVGEKMFAKLQPYLTVSGPTTLTAKVSSAAPKTEKTKKGAAKPPKTKST